MKEKGERTRGKERIDGEKQKNNNKINGEEKKGRRRRKRREGKKEKAIVVILDTNRCLHVKVVDFYVMMGLGINL